jgi:hypothetical protein
VRCLEFVVYKGNNMNKKINGSLRLFEMSTASQTNSNITKFTKEDRKSFLESIRKYKEFGSAIYRSGNINEVISQIENLISIAENMTLQETDGWFDSVTTSRHVKQMKECLKTLQTEAKEISSRQQRFEAAYEDIGQLLEKYYEI